MLDKYGREINYMRISITDRCNLRCRYCMPDGIKKVPMSRILTYEQIEEICRAAVSLKIDRFRVTGGEPLVRLGCPGLIRSIKEIRGVKSVTLTTNGILLEEMCGDLVRAGLDGVNISLDTLDSEKYRFITGSDSLEQTLKGIDAAFAHGIPVKVNAVLQKGINEDDWQDLIRLSKDRSIDVRFIELMPIGEADSSESVSNETIYQKIKASYPDVRADHSVHGSGPAGYVHIPGFSGSIGFISAIHGKFCKNCNRIRLTSKGLIKTCLCYSDATDLVPALNETDPSVRFEKIRFLLRKAVSSKQQEHHFERSDDITEQKKMYEIGG